MGLIFIFDEGDYLTYILGRSLRFVAVLVCILSRWLDEIFPYAYIKKPYTI